MNLCLVRFDTNKACPRNYSAPCKEFAYSVIIYIYIFVGIYTDIFLGIHGSQKIW